VWDRVRVTTTDNLESAGSATGAVGKLASISLDCIEPSVLADFYCRLLGMTRLFETPDGHVIALTDGASILTVMWAENHQPPTWPEPGQLQQMHLDVAVTDLPTAVTSALAIGAREAAFQAAPDVWRVLIDPAGHPFCLTTVVPV
jgi:hypothetical protein